MDYGIYNPWNNDYNGVKCANYVERFVVSSGYSESSTWKMFICTNVSQNLCDGGRNILGIYNPWNNVYNGVVADF